MSLLYEFPFNLNPSHIPNDSKKDSSSFPIIAEDQFQEYLKKIIRSIKKAHQILAMLLARKMNEKSIKTLYEKHSSKIFVKNCH